MFYSIAIPVNIDGHGPETQEDLIKDILWEVWDQTSLPVHSAKDEDEANRVAESLNEYWRAINGP